MLDKFINSIFRMVGKPVALNTGLVRSKRNLDIDFGTIDRSVEKREYKVGDIVFLSDFLDSLSAVPITSNNRLLYYESKLIRTEDNIKNYNEVSKAYNTNSPLKVRNSEKYKRVKIKICNGSESAIVKLEPSFKIRDGSKVITTNICGRINMPKLEEV